MAFKKDKVTYDTTATKNITINQSINSTFIPHSTVIIEISPKKTTNMSDIISIRIPIDRLKKNTKKAFDYFKEKKPNEDLRLLCFQVNPSKIDSALKTIISIFNLENNTEVLTNKKIVRGIIAQQHLFKKKYTDKVLSISFAEE